MRTRADYDAIRTQVRPRLGLGGLRDSGLGIPSAVLGGASATFRAAFPAVEETFTPGDLQPSQSTGSPVAAWLTAHVIRPEAEVQVAPGVTMRWAPGDGQADWSGVAKAVTALLAALGAGAAAWLLVRALVPAARARRRAA